MQHITFHERRLGWEDKDRLYFSTFDLVIYVQSSKNINECNFYHFFDVLSTSSKFSVIFIIFQRIFFDTIEIFCNFYHFLEDFFDTIDIFCNSTVILSDFPSKQQKIIFRCTRDKKMEFKICRSFFPVYTVLNLYNRKHFESKSIFNFSSFPRRYNVTD